MGKGYARLGAYRRNAVGHSKVEGEHTGAGKQYAQYGDIEIADAVPCDKADCDNQHQREGQNRDKRGFKVSGKYLGRKFRGRIAAGFSRVAARLIWKTGFKGVPGEGSAQDGGFRYTDELFIAAGDIRRLCALFRRLREESRRAGRVWNLGGKQRGENEDAYHGQCGGKGNEPEAGTVRVFSACF